MLSGLLDGGWVESECVESDEGCAEGAGRALEGSEAVEELGEPDGEGEEDS